MPVSSKKKRGKQRKAAKTIRAAVDILGELAAGPDRLGPFGIKLLERGHNKATLLLAKPDTDDSFPSGALSTVLNFLKRCENESFSQVMTSVRIKVRSVDGADGGDLESPSTWISILRKALRQDQKDLCISLQIAENIGPLVRCMCDDTTRLFFKSGRHWREGIATFVQLISGMIMKSSSSSEHGQKLVNSLLNHEGLLSSIVQWKYWGHERTDIMKELSIDDYTNIISFGKNTVGYLVEISEECKNAEDRKKQLRVLGASPIVSQDYDPTCTISCVAGMVRQLKNGWEVRDFSYLQNLIIEADCVDKGVITEMIDLGMNHTHDCEIACFVVSVSHDMLQRYGDGEEEALSDTRTAFAIRAGLIEMCLNFIGRFGDHESFHKNDDPDLSLFVNIEATFGLIHKISLHQKTAKAIRSKKTMIEEKLLCMEQNTNTTNNPNCKKLLDMVKSILNLNGSYCCRCNKSLTKTEVMECNGCHRMTYCSRTCQKEDWLNGHSLTCCKSSTDVTAGEAFAFFQGRVHPRTRGMPQNQRNSRRTRR